jgi:hypothetical protein
MELLMLTTTAILLGAGLLATGALGGFVAARLFRTATPAADGPALADPVSVATLAPFPVGNPMSRTPERDIPLPILVQYDPDAEDEDDIPTTLYRNDDEAVEALLAEFDTEHERRSGG